MIQRRPAYHVHVRHSELHVGFTTVRVVKSWWNGPGDGGHHAEVWSAQVPTPDEEGSERLYAVLFEAIVQMRASGLELR